MNRPYVLLSCAISVDGYLDDSRPARRILSSEADLDRVDEVRAGVDAILVGANTIRRDDPRLVVRSARRRASRQERGLPADPVKVTITRTGELDPSARFFTVGDAEKLVYAATGAVSKTEAALATVELAEAGQVGVSVVDAGDPPQLPLLLADLAERGIRRLMVEGGSGILSWFLAERLADELHLVIAPVVIADPDAPRWLRDGAVSEGRMTLLETRQIDDCVLLRYDLQARDVPG